MSKSAHSLQDVYDLGSHRLFLTGPQAIVRMALMQSERDRQAGFDTAGYVSGYRGSPVGTVDNQFMAARAALEPRNIRFQAGLNEDLAATALWGSQQAEMRGEGRFDGVFGIWYGKGPGVDRTGDVFRHANMAGTSALGGVLVIAGDDHSGESSTVVHASDFALSDAMIPVLSPAGVQEIIDFGLLGIALSRYAGVWVGLKCVHDTVESSAVVAAGPERGAAILPMDHRLPADGLNIRPSDERSAQEFRLHHHKMPAVAAFVRDNAINRIVMPGGKRARLGIAAPGKSYLDVRQALDSLGIGDGEAARLGIRLLKIGMVWPLEPTVVRDFARGLDTIIVVEEKRPLIETQLRDILYAEERRPEIFGKALFPAYGVLEPHLIAVAVADKLGDPIVKSRAEALRSAAVLSSQPDLVERVPYFCAGCPHNSSTVLPEAARGYAGIGCHWLAQFVPGRKTEGATQMGGEGANWVGEAPFSKRRHVFQNIGDGTYNHSGLMAIRHAVGSGTTMTYKILFNDAVAMTGGQRNDGGLTVPQIARQMRAIGVERIAVVSDEPGKYPADSGFPDGVTFSHRDDIQKVQGALMDVPGTSVLIYDQTCAAEKRRRRRRGQFPDPARRVVINELVCEGCGDCGEQSNCVAIAPVETPFGRKRRIDQSACNKDFSCLKGFCPSFVTVEGGELRKPGGKSAADLSARAFRLLPEPELPSLARPWNILIAGIGGTGVVTIGHLLGMAAHVEDRGAALIDMVGISQKNGAVVTHLKIAAGPEDISAVRVGAGEADLILGCDLVAAASTRILQAAGRERTVAVVNTHEAMPAHFTHDAGFDMRGPELATRVAGAVREQGFHGIDATAIAGALLGDAIAANLFTLGFAWQRGLVPVGRAAIAESLKLNGASVEMNLAAFEWGRRAAVDEGEVRAAANAEAGQAVETLDEMVARRVEFLISYQDRAYADAYAQFVEKVRLAPGGSAELTAAVAVNLFKLMAYKDEYEVARLYSDGSFARGIARQFKGGYRLRFHLAPPLLGRMDAATGRPRKTTFGPWVMPVFGLLARLKFLRGTRLDPFGWSAERRLERRLIADYRARIEGLLQNLQLSAPSMPLVVELARLPDMVRGFGPVKEANIRRAEARAHEIVALMGERPGRALRAAAE